MYILANVHIHNSETSWMNIRSNKFSAWKATNPKHFFLMWLAWLPQRNVFNQYLQMQIHFKPQHKHFILWYLLRFNKKTCVLSHVYAPVCASSHKITYVFCCVMTDLLIYVNKAYFFFLEIVAHSDKVKIWRDVDKRLLHVFLFMLWQHLVSTNKI